MGRRPLRGAFCDQFSSTRVAKWPLRDPLRDPKASQNLSALLENLGVYVCTKNLEALGTENRLSAGETLDDVGSLRMQRDQSSALLDSSAWGHGLKHLPNGTCTAKNNGQQNSLWQ